MFTTDTEAGLRSSTAAGAACRSNGVIADANTGSAALREAASAAASATRLGDAARRDKALSDEGTAPLRVLALVYHFAPALDSASIRNTKILGHVPGFSVSLDVVTIRTKHVASDHDPSLLDRLPAGLNVVRTSCLFPHRALTSLKRRVTAQPAVSTQTAPHSRSARRNLWQTFKDVLSYALVIPDKYVGWYPFALWAGYARMRKSKSDVIYAVGQPWTAFFVGYTLKLLSGKPLVVDFMDPWASRAEAWDHDKPKILSRIAARLERFIVRRADLIIANTEELAEDFRRRFRLAPGSVGVITCGFDPADFRSLPPKHEGAALVITHTGSCYGLRSPLNLLTAVKTLIERGRVSADGIRLNLIGHVPVQEPRLRALLDDPSMKGVVHIESWVPHTVALERLSRSDVLLLLQPGLQLAIPAKLYEYAAIGRPILALAELDGGVARVVREARLGVTVDNADVAGITRELERLIVEFHEGRLRAQYRREDVAKYSVESLGAELASLLRQVQSRAERPAQRSGM